MARFSQKLQEYFVDPPNTGAMDHATVTGCSDRLGRTPNVTLYLDVRDDLVQAAKFTASGCGVTIAAAAALTELVLGRSLTECATIQAEQIARALDGLPNDKMYCAYIALAALEDALVQVSPRAG